ncbi:hypothetical protein F4811DRAFT_548656 [Daldinia bambusicola]|nr:hypothetical protein F4811DRAFT_548656 [Daldinia bambusicola]
MSYSHGRSITDYNLFRVYNDSEPMFLRDMLEYMGAEYIEDASDISLPNFAYVINTVNMWYMPEPTMKHRDIIVDNYKAAGGDLSTLRRIGVSFIVNTSVYGCIEAAFAVRGRVFPEIGEPDSPGWRELVRGNPFLRGQQKMLREYSAEFKNARIEKVTVAARGKNDLIDIHLLFMVTHLAHDEEGKANGQTTAQTNGKARPLPPPPEAASGQNAYADWAMGYEYW